MKNRKANILEIGTFSHLSVKFISETESIHICMGKAYACSTCVNIPNQSKCGNRRVDQLELWFIHGNNLSMYSNTIVQYIIWVTKANIHI